MTARADKPFVRDAYAERALDVWLLVDLSASIDWGTARCLKRDRAIEMAAVAGTLLGQRGNRVGALLFAERPIELVPPMAGEVQPLRVLARLRGEPRQAAPGRTDLRTALERADRVLKRRSFLVVVSDFLVTDGWQVALRTLAARHEVVAVRLRDPREGELPDVGLVTLEDPETDAQMIVDTHDRRLRERFRRAAEVQAGGIGADLTACGVDTLVVGTDEELLPVLSRFLLARRRRGVRRVAGAVRGGIR